MNNDFARIITLLRKERGISQKQAANDLQISQALLSHYEKGIRECGLDFVVKVSEYYKVSCDYLLGKSPVKSGAIITVDDIPDNNSSDDKKYKGSILATLNKRLIINSISIIFDTLQNCNCKSLTTEVSSYLMLSTYKMFRILYSANSKNPQGIFSVPLELQKGLSDAAQSICEANAQCLSHGIDVNDMKGTSTTAEMTSDSISKKYPALASSLYNLIQSSETRINSLKK